MLWMYFLISFINKSLRRGVIAIIKKRLAINEKGELTYCTSPEDKIGIGRCNHIAHIMDGESIEDFNNRCNSIIFKNKTELKSKNIKKLNDKILKTLLNSDYKEDVIEAMQSLIDYAEYVARFNLNSKSLRARKDSMSIESYQSAFKEMDENRRIKHNAAIINLSMLNRICKIINIDSFYPGDPNVDDRGDVAESIFNYFKGFF